jgi:hypothetical protein
MSFGEEQWQPLRNAGSNIKHCSGRAEEKLLVTYAILPCHLKNTF